MNRQDEILVELLGRDTPQVKALLAAAGQAGMEGAVHEMLRSLVRQQGWNPDDPPRFSLPQGMSASDYVVGTAVSGDVRGEDVGPSETDLPSHIGIFGMTATGKTTLVKTLLLAFTRNGTHADGAGRTFFVWDVHGEYRDMLPLFEPDELVWLTADELGINPFAVPNGEDGKPVMAPEKWINNIREWLRMFWLNEPSCNLFCEVLRDEYERRGVLAGGEDYPSLSDVLDALQALDMPRNSDRARAKEKLLDRLESLRALLPGLDVQRSRDFARLMDRSVILDVSDVKDIALPVLFSLLVTIHREVFRSDGDAGITRMMAMEESHEYMGGQTDRRTADLKEGKPSSVLRDLRKTGTCGVVVSQLISDVARAVLGNLGTVFCLRQGHRDCVRQAAAALNLAPWQETEIAKLPNRHAICRFSRHGEPVCLEVKDARALFPPGLPPPSREQARERSRPVLEAIPYVKRGGRPAAGAGERSMGEGGPAAAGDGGNAREAAGPGGGTRHGEGLTAGGVRGKGLNGKPLRGEGLPAAAEGGLHPREKRVFARICEWPWELIDDRMDALGMDREAEGAARGRLEALGLIAFAGKVGAKHRLFEPTARGRTVAEKMGLAVAKTGKGSAVHEAIAWYTQRSLARHSTAFRFQRSGVSPTVAGVQPDLLLLTSGGSRIPVQACYRNQPAAEADALLRLHRLALLEPGDAAKVDFVLAVACSKAHGKAIERALVRQNGGSLPGRVVLLDFDSTINPAFDWSQVFEVPI